MIELTTTKLTVKGKGGPEKKDYAAEINFHGEVNPDESKQLVNPNKLFFTVMRKEAGEYWPRLLNDKSKQHWLKVDFDKWKDEDDDEEEDKPDDYDMPGMQGMGGGPGGFDMEAVRVLPLSYNPHPSSFNAHCSWPSQSTAVRSVSRWLPAVYAPFLSHVHPYSVGRTANDPIIRNLNPETARR